jgi:hypothetical protein
MGVRIKIERQHMPTRGDQEKRLAILAQRREAQLEVQWISDSVEQDIDRSIQLRFNVIA